MRKPSKAMVASLLFHLALLLSFPAMSAEWKIDKREGAVDLSVTGNITHGSLQRFIFRKNQCDRVIHTFSAFTMPTEPVDFDKMTGKTFVIRFNGEKIGARLKTALWRT